MRVAQLGNFDPENSTENHLRLAMLANGHDVETYQENDLGRWKILCEELADFDFVLWTRTGWQPPVPRNLQARLLTRGQSSGVPIVGYHLDRWWGLNREPQVRQEMFFRADLVVTADGGHDDEWREAKVNHMWLPPGVLGTQAAELGEWDDRFDVDVAFVGSWREYHAEWAYRGRLVRWLQDTYGDRFRVWEGGVRGKDLADLYRTTRVIVGDSCLAGGATRYWSDRIPETLGRGGFLIHPNVEGLADHFDIGLDLLTYDLGDFDGLRAVIDGALAPGVEAWREAITVQGRAHVRALHTYERRVEQVITVLADSGMLRLPDDRRALVGRLRERIDLVPLAEKRTPVPVIWLALHDDVMVHGYWDQGLLDRLLDGRAWAPATTYEWQHREVTLGPDDVVPADGAVVVLPGRFHEHDGARVQGLLDRMDWVVLIVTSDEESLFPWWELRHPRMRIWVQYPDREGAERYLPVGYQADTPENIPADHPRSLLWAFAGQVTHERRQEFSKAAEGVAGGRFEASPGFLAGLDRGDYLALLADATVAPCPSGPEHPDTFRLWEALEAGCVPILDYHPPRHDRLGVWPLIAPRMPAPVVRDWADFRDVLYGIDFREQAADVGAWWLARKRDLAYGLIDDVSVLSGQPPAVRSAADQITAVVTVSPIVGHPSTDMIEETVKSIRDRLPHVEIILACDGIRPEQAHLAGSYWEHLRRLTRLASREWHNVLPVLMGEHLHQAITTRQALELVRTPTVLFLEHDTPLIGDQIPWAELATAVMSGVANSVRFHHEAQVLDAHQHLMLDREPVIVEGQPLLRTAQWSQRPHLASTEFYRNVLSRYFGTEARTMIEDVMHGVVDHAWRTDREQGWERFRLWLYAPPGDVKRSTHLDGRAGESKFEDRWVFAYDGPPPVGAPYPTRARP